MTNCVLVTTETGTEELSVEMIVPDSSHMHGFDDRLDVETEILNAPLSAFQ